MFLIYLYVFLTHRKPFPIPINVIYTDVAKLDKYISLSLSLFLSINSEFSECEYSAEL